MRRMVMSLMAVVVSFMIVMPMIVVCPVVMPRVIVVSMIIVCPAVVPRVIVVSPVGVIPVLVMSTMVMPIMAVIIVFRSSGGPCHSSSPQEAAVAMCFHTLAFYR